MVTHIWYIRAKCNCGYFWTTGTNQSIVCKCGTSKIENGVVITGDAVTNEEAFKLSIAEDYNEDVNEIIIEQGT